MRKPSISASAGMRPARASSRIRCSTCQPCQRASAAPAMPVAITIRIGTHHAVSPPIQMRIASSTSGTT